MEDKEELDIRAWGAKKHDRVILGKKKMTIRQYIKAVARQLPSLKYSESGSSVDHEKLMKQEYIKKGLQAVKDYISGVQTIYKELIDEAKKGEDNRD